jgi:hypothetical protein
MMIESDHEVVEIETLPNNTNIVVSMTEKNIIESIEPFTLTSSDDPVKLFVGGLPHDVTIEELRVLVE